MFSKTHTKYIQSLHHKKFRDELGMFIAEGTKVVMELITGNKYICTTIFALPTWFAEHEKALKNFAEIECIEVKDFELEKISTQVNPSSVLAVFEKPTFTPKIEIKNKLTLVLDGIQDPGNMGTLIRIADWFGIAQIICSTTCADMYSPKVVQSAMGSLSRVTILYTNLVTWLSQNEGVRIYGATLNGEYLSNLKIINEGILVIGNEGKGITPEVMEFIHKKITIQKIGGAESLNAAVATGIILSHIIYTV
jgi:RNA methyltransferase, TrmH family